MKKQVEKARGHLNGTAVVWFLLPIIRAAVDHDGGGHDDIAAFPAHIDVLRKNRIHVWNSAEHTPGPVPDPVLKSVRIARVGEIEVQPSGLRAGDPGLWESAAAPLCERLKHQVGRVQLRVEVKDKKA
jgi:hypothetical protein